MAPRIYTSPIPDVPIVEKSVFSHLFSTPSEGIVGGYPSTARAFVDADSGTTLTRGQLKRFALTLGFGLRDHPTTAVRRGEVVLIYSQNSLNWPVALFGSVTAGMRCTLANSAYTPKELAYQYTDSGARLVMASEEGLANVMQMFRELGVDEAEARRRVIVLGSSLEWAGGPAVPRKSEAVGLLAMEDLLVRGVLEEEEKFDGELAHETAYLCYSSGTTGKPKGVETTHKNITSVLEIVKPTFPKLNADHDSVLGFLPFYHIYGAVKLLHFPFACGSAVIIQSRFDPEQFCASIERYKITVALIVPPVLVVLARHPAVKKYNISSLRTLFSGAAPLGAALVRQVTERLKADGKATVDILQGYGLTETSPTTHLLPVPDALRKIGSIGILLANLEARLLVDGDGDGDVEAAEGQPGELWFRGPTIMKGYLNNAVATKDSITADGWFKTGDIAIRDAEGYYYIVDRRKELIKYKGFQVPPAELESVLLSHPEIADAAVIGVDSAKEATELPRAYVVHAQPDQVKSDAAKVAFQDSVRTWIQSRVARHKFLRGGVLVIDVVPKSAAGKILRRELRERAKTELQGRDPSDDMVRAKL